MAQDYTTYLAANVLNDKLIVTYRSLARACKVHSNVAKRMLYDFHARQNAKKPGSIHATYLVSGVQSTKAIVNSNVTEVNEDVHMQSSPFMGSSMPRRDVEEEASTVKVMTLVQEQHLNAVKERYDTMSSVHVYSLEPNPIQDLQVLSDVKRDISAKYALEDPLLVGSQYGTIENPKVKRRTAPRPSFVPAASTVAGESKIEIKSVSQAIPAAPSENVQTSQVQMKVATKHDGPKDANRKVTSKKPVLKREQSDIFKSFSKPKRKMIREGTESSIDANSTPATPKSEALDDPQDEPMVDASEDEQEEDIKALSKDTPKDDQPQRKSRSDRAEALRKMMDDEDELMENASEPSAPAANHSQPNDAPEQPEAVTESLVVVSGSRRRGRRKVMQKKTIKDDEGYLVTKEEATWESFSEDEPSPALQTKTPASSGSSSVTGKAKKMGGRPGQGNIMSFFGKK
ncbi:hypothetical protein MMC27_006536 [Xylographa pallens]|nr:hypothetical protein [Xylographa pallens]